MLDGPWRAHLHSHSLSRTHARDPVSRVFVSDLVNPTHLTFSRRKKKNSDPGAHSVSAHSRCRLSCRAGAARWTRTLVCLFLRRAAGAPRTPPRAWSTSRAPGPSCTAMNCRKLLRTSPLCRTVWACEGTCTLRPWRTLRTEQPRPTRQALRGNTASFWKVWIRIKRGRPLGSRDFTTQTQKVCSGQEC